MGADAASEASTRRLGRASDPRNATTNMPIAHQNVLPNAAAIGGAM